MNSSSAPQGPLAGPRSQEQSNPAGLNRIEKLLILTLGVLFFFPKVDLFSVPGFTIQSKPEDVVWLLSIGLLLTSRVRFNGSVRISWLIVIIYVLASTSLHFSNVVLAARLFFYSIPLFFVLTFSRGFVSIVSRMCRWFLATMAIVAVLQVSTPFPHLHTGVLGIGPIDRAPGIYGNGVEFALMGLFAYWLPTLCGDKRLWPLAAAIVIAYCSGTRLVLAALLFSSILLFSRLAIGWRISFIAIAAIVLLFASTLADSTEESRLAEIDPSAVVAAVALVLSNVQGAQSTPDDQEGYCFEFDDTLSEDQSFAMRLSKLLFVVEHVVLGPNRLGFGVGKCIGDAGDNLYVRMLSDGGLPFLFLFSLFLTCLWTHKASRRVSALTWRFFVVVFAGVSLFYDTLYFSRVAPIILLCISLELSFRLQEKRLSAKPIVTNSHVPAA